MAEQQRDKIEYDFEDLRRNEDPIPDNVLDQLGLEDEDLTEDERQDDTKAKDDSEELDDRDEEDIELDEDGEYKPAKMTNAMRKRIMKVKRDAKRDIAAAKAEAGEEISKLTKRIDELEKSGKTDELDNEFTGKLEDLESQMEAAMEDGDSKKVTSLTRQMSELTADIRDRKRELERDEPDDLEDEEEDKQKIIPRAVEWLKEQEWWDDEDLGHVRAYVRKADIALQKKGYKPTDDDFYEQLEAAVEKKYPGIVEHTMDEYEDEDEDLDLDEEFEEEDEDEFVDIPSKKKRRKAKKKRRARSPVSEGDRGGVSRTKKKFRKKKARTLTKARIKNMQIFGMDPEDPEQVEAYLDNNP
jgi:hypothetical protein